MFGRNHDDDPIFDANDVVRWAVGGMAVGMGPTLLVSALGLSPLLALPVAVVFGLAAGLVDRRHRRQRESQRANGADG